MTFEVWEHESLVSFAKAAFDRINELEEELDQVKQDKKDAIQAYRELIKLHEKIKPSKH